jgi:hypothetical protein
MAARNQKPPKDTLPVPSSMAGKAVIPEPRDKDPKVLYLQDEPEKTRAQILARELMDGDSSNAITAVNFANAGFGGELGITESIEALRSQIQRVQAGDLAKVEGILFGQASALASIFHECARRAAINMGQYPEATERYMRLALKAQSQCRTTLETLVETKHPKSVAFVRQANIANNQQVNNGDQPQGRAEVFESERNELQPVPARSLAAGAAPEGVRADSGTAAVVEIDRAKDRRREG